MSQPPFLFRQCCVQTATKKAALALDWTEDKWDDDWELWDLEVEHKYWKEMTEEEKAGAMHFGYTQHTWDGQCRGYFALLCYL
jgi:phosphoribosylformimino-5-aminoimidazole carboxamide ribonucleotide (ProFAR) isomerase